MRVPIILAIISPCLVFAQQPLSSGTRLKWAAVSTVGTPNLSGAVFTSAFATAYNRPPEYGPHWDGFGKRYGLRLTGSATSNVMEAGLSALWGEDPRYFRLGSSESVGRRIKGSLKQAFLARDRNGNTMPAYARYIAMPGSNFLSNTWRPDSQANVSGAMLRTGLGFAARITANLFAEFWPDISRRKK